MIKALHKESARLSRALFARAFAAGLIVYIPLASAEVQPVAWRPEKTVEIIVGVSAGGGTDITARVLQKIFHDKKLVENSVVVNKTGGGHTVAWTYLNQHVGDGHYIQIINEPLVTNRIIGVSPLNYNDFTVLALLFDEYVIFNVKPDSPLKSARDLIERLRRDPAAVAFGFAPGLVNNTHMAIGMVGKAAGLDVTKMKLVVFNSGADANTALLGGHIDVAVTTPATVLGLLQAGRVRGLALTAPNRLAGNFAGVPTWQEFGVDAVYSTWRIVFGPKGLTSPQIAFWEKMFAAVAETEEWKQDLATNVRVSHFLDSAGARKFLEAENKKLKAILSNLGMTKP